MIGSRRGRQRLLITALLSMLATPIPSSGQTTSARARPASDVVREISFTSAALKGNLLGDPVDQKFAVYLPPGYDASAERYPVIYLLHGIGDDYQTWTDGYHVPAMLDSLIAAKRIAPLIVVMPNGRNRLLGSYYLNSPVTGGWSDLVSKEIVGKVDAMFRTIDRPESRAVVGHSMGGFGAIHFGMTAPDIFSIVYAISPCCLDATEDIGWGNIAAWKTALALEDDAAVAAALKRGDFYPVAIVAFLSATTPNPAARLRVDLPIRLVRGELMPQEPFYTKWRDALPLQQVDALRANLRRLKALRIDVGLSDQFAHIPPSVEGFSQALSRNRIPHVLEIYEGEHHDIGDRLATIVFPFVSSALRRSPP